jgi:hypothetical protein
MLSLEDLKLLAEGVEYKCTPQLFDAGRHVSFPVRDLIRRTRFGNCWLQARGVGRAHINEEFRLCLREKTDNGEMTLICELPDALTEHQRIELISEFPALTLGR